MAENKKPLGKAQQRVDDIYAELLDRIRLLRYPPGTRLSEIELAKEFGISRTPIRRVLQRLEFENLAERTQGSYTTVTSYDLDSVLDIYELRMVLLENLDRLSGEVLDSAGIEALESLRERIVRLSDSPDLEELGRIHIEYQAKLADCIKNTYAKQLALQMYNQIARLWLQKTPELDWKEEIRILNEEISSIIEAMKAGDIRAVGYIRRNHISMNVHRLKYPQKNDEKRH